MKFTQNAPVISPNTIGDARVRVVADPMAYGTGGKEYSAMAGAIGQWAKVAQKEQDDKDAADLMEARNRIMGSLTESMYGENGILTNGVGENAKGLQGRVHDTVQKTFDNISKGYNRRVQAALRGNLSENMGNYMRIAASQEGREFTKQKTAQYGISIDNGVNLSMVNYENGDILNNTINDLMNIVDYRAKDQGFSEMQRQQERRRVLTAVVGGTMQAAIDNGDLDTASIYADRYGKYMEQGELMKFQKVLRQEKRLKDEKNEIEELTKKFVTASGEPDWNRIEQEIKTRAKQTKVVGGGSNDRFVRIAQKTAALIRQKIPNASPNLEKYLYGQMVHETGNFTNDRALANNNFAGLHGGADGKHYANDDEYIKDYASFFTEGYHGNAVTAESGKEFARRLSQSGWFTDPNVEGYGNNIEASYAEYDKKAAAGGGGNYDKGYNSIVGNKMDYGEVGCVEAVVKGGKAAGIPFFEKQSAAGVVDCDTLKQNATAAGIAVEDFDPANPPRKGDVIIYDRGEKQHAVTADGQGGYWGNSSSQGIVVHGGDYNEMGGKVPTQVIRTGSLGGGGGHTVNAHDSGWEDRMIKRMEAARSDWNRRKADEGKARLEGYETQIQNAGSAAGALSILERIKSSEKDPAIYSKAIQVARTYYPDAFKETNSITGTRRSRSSSNADSGYTGKSGKHYSTRQYEEAKETNRLYRDHVKLQNQGLYKISDDEQKRAIKSSRITNDVENAAYDDDGIAAAARAYAENKGDFYGAINTLVEQAGMTQDEASRYISKYLEWHAADED